VSDTSTDAGSAKPTAPAAEQAGTPQDKGLLSAGSLIMLTVVAVASLRGLPAMSVYGLGSITLYVIPALVFLVPTALVAAELAVWRGGVYTWVREAMGNRWGFTAIWLQWIQNVVWYPVQLAFCAAGIAYMILKPGLANSGLYTAITILVFYWLATLIALAGGNLFAKVSSWGGIIGTIIPGAILIVLGVWWMASGQPSEISLKASTIIPPFTGLASIVLIVSNFLAYAGMEMNAVHVNDMKEPKRFPFAILMASLLILAIFIVPTISVGLVVPAKDTGLTTGIMEAFSKYFTALGLGQWATVLISGMIVIGALAGVVAWIAGPSKGLLLASRTGLLPVALQKRNGKGVQQGILILQGIVVSLLASLFLFSANVSAAFFALVDMAAALYLIMYMMMFASAIILRRTKPDVQRTYRVPMMDLVAGVGFLASAAGFIFSFIQSSQAGGGMSNLTYGLLVAAVCVVLGAPPLIFYAIKKPGWRTITDAEFAGMVGDHATPPSVHAAQEAAAKAST